MNEGSKMKEIKVKGGKGSQKKQIQKERRKEKADYVRKDKKSYKRGMKEARLRECRGAGDRGKNK